MKALIFKIKRWYLFNVALTPKVGDVVCYYPTSIYDTYRHKIILSKYDTYRACYVTIDSPLVRIIEKSYFNKHYILEQYVKDFY